MSLTERLAALPERPPQPPSGWRPRVDVSETGATIVTESKHVESPTDEPEDVEFSKLLNEHGMSPDLWTIKSHSSSRWQASSGEWRESHRIIAIPLAPKAPYDLPDLDDLHKAVRRTRRKPHQPTTDQVSVVGVLSDLQIGKAHDSRGGTEETLARLEDSRQRWFDYVTKVQPEEIVLLDAGDPIENFDNVARQTRTNDLQLTEQIRVWRRVFWTWVELAAQMAPSVKVASVPSNHGQLRKGKNPIGPATDDYGIEVLAQIADIAKANPEKYGHVQFYAPAETEEALALQLTGGRVLGLVHGHQVSSIDRLHDWWSGQSHGRTPVGQADVLVAGHFHNFRVSTSGDDRWIFVAPTADAGSAWFRNLRGHDAPPGVLTFTMGPDGWDGLTLC